MNLHSSANIASDHVKTETGDAVARPACGVSVVVINLDRDSDRLSFMTAQLNRLGLPFTRFPGIVGADLPSDLHDYFTSGEGGFLSVGEVGCYASHLAVYEAIENGSIAAPVLVLEDDVALPDDLPALLRDLCHALPAGWDFVRLSSPSKRAYVTAAKLGSERALVRYSISPGSNGALLVSASGARRFTKRIARRLPIDQDNRRLWEFDLQLYGVEPAPVRGNSLGTSTIDDLKASQFRDDPARQRFLSRERALWRRHAWNMKEFGFGAWAASEAANMIVPLLRRESRSKFLTRTGDWLGSFASGPR